MNLSTHPISADRIDAAWIDRALHVAGVIPPGSVEAIDIERSDERTWSSIVRVGVRYRRDVPGAPPARLLVKMCGGDAFGRSEVDYYCRDYLTLPSAPLARCFGAAYAANPVRYHLLLEDLSATHVDGDHVSPDERYGHALAEALAALHAHRCGAERLRQIDQSLPGRVDVEAYVGHVAQGLEPMLAQLGSEFAARWDRRLRSLFDGLAARFTHRASDPRGMTAVHGDVNPGNVLVPRTGGGPVLLVDRQPFGWSLTRWLGIGDLVCAMVPWWDTPVRRQLEMSVLERYGDALRAHGVIDYPMAKLRADYRLCLAMAVAVPVQWCVLAADRERMRWLWTLQLQRALAALDDHR